MNTPQPSEATETMDADIANRITNALIVKGISVRALSDATGIAYPTLRLRLKGGRSLTFQEFNKITAAIQVHPATLLPTSLTDMAA